jgi:hypothetical protein
MTKDELIARQQLDIESMKEQIKAYKDSEDNIYNIIYCIGGPLNDNKLGYTKEQMQDFAAISLQLG